MRAAPQPGIFALGTPSHAYLEFDANGHDDGALVRAIASLREPRKTVGGVNLVVGVRPELWRAVAPDDCPADLAAFTAPVVGDDGFRMPATQHDVILWVAGSAYDVVFDVARAAIAALAPVATLAAEVASWAYQHDRDLTGFIDGSENPSLVEAADVAVIAADAPGAGGSVLLVQKWTHDAARWGALPEGDQERAMGRTKRDSIELTDRPVNSHVARTDQDEVGHVFRRNMPYGTVAEHGTMFVGFCAEQRPLQVMLERMAGCAGGPRDALTFYTTPVTGSYYFVPSLAGLRRFGDAED